MAGFNFQQVKANLERTKRELPVVLAKQAENYFTETFDKGGLGSQKWPEVQRRIPGTFAYKWPSKPKASSRTSPILVRTGNLRRKVSRSIHNATWQQVKLVVDLPYAQIHEEGGTIHKKESQSIVHFKGNKFSTKKNATHAQKVTVGAHDLEIPARPYMKQTPELTGMQERKVKELIDKIWT